MQNELVKVDDRLIGGTVVQSVNARDLHAFLGVGRDFSTWLKSRVDEFGFEENADYVCSPVRGSKRRGASNRVEFFISIDMAKELSMVERNVKGKEVRRYFIACERRALDAERLAKGNPTASISAPVNAYTVGGIVKKSRQAAVAEISDTVQSETDRTVGAILKGVSRILDANRHIWKKLKKIEKDIAYLDGVTERLEKTILAMRREQRARTKAKGNVVSIVRGQSREP